MNKNARLFVFAAPSGAGKTTLVKAMVERFPTLRFSVSYTTRKRRKDEQEGRDYFFVSTEQFRRLEADGELLESAIVFDNHYGTSRSQVEKHLADGHNVLLEIDWQGARQVRESMPDCVSVFILPPSRQELARRLQARRTDSDAVIARRLGEALSDMSHWDEFDYCIINDSLDLAVAEMATIFGGTNQANRRDNTTLQADIQRILAQP
ncbi:MAG: guanylate kinase [Gammaproteobacteria bacterium]|nr:guanylate kinase [Gammaproteobacteria bacterium]